ncbi:GDP-mannose 4,6-dehydratase [Candidatus Neptunochlamydia vexilliferae]|uniref:dTDP-glucose 4,6-dehydratase n=1 Tax=Candidatus Neptunichlamydia vexilliferae TaxID=1651774 RepID=A0ABS0AY45_9BACT|nr:GDP-mannose 4,6-dehydratase [Candidatus Neptunochlamydia vexilliferae]MBF5059051.1 dTDP-glucose 4,6-dehydratase [Candidatus Neptunochlamydia vexilliferae]
MKKVLVIGSNSFSGSDFIDLLLEKGEYEVTGISRSSEKESLFLPYKTRTSPHFTFEQIDLNKDLAKLDRLLGAFQPEYIVNFAAQSEVGPSWENPDHWFQTNAVALTSLANLLKDKKWLKKYVHISSPEVYGTCEGFIKESTPVNPSTPYAASKAAGDLSLFTFQKNFDFPLVMVRATNVYGAHQQLFKIIPRTAIYIKNKKKIQLHGGGVAVKSYIHIRDVSQGELLVMEKGRVGDIYHISPDQGVAVKDVVETICKKMDVPMEEAVEIAPERLGQDKAYTIDSSKIREELGWKPEISLEEGIDQTVKWVNAHFDAINKQPLEYIHKK